MYRFCYRGGPCGYDIWFAGKWHFVTDAFLAGFLFVAAIVCLILFAAYLDSKEKQRRQSQELTVHQPQQTVVYKTTEELEQEARWHAANAKRIIEAEREYVAKNNFANTVWLVENRDRLLEKRRGQHHQNSQ